MQTISIIIITIIIIINVTRSVYVMLYCHYGE